MRTIDPKSIRQQCIAKGISYDVVRSRLQWSWTIDQAINTPVGKQCVVIPRSKRIGVKPEKKPQLARKSELP